MDKILVANKPAHSFFLFNLALHSPPKSVFSAQLLNATIAALCQWRTKVFMRFGTSPTGMMATCFKVFVSMTETDSAAEFETYTRLLSGVNVIHSGTAPVRARPSG